VYFSERLRSAHNPNGYFGADDVITSGARGVHLHLHEEVRRATSSESCYWSWPLQPLKKKLSFFSICDGLFCLNFKFTGIKEVKHLYMCKCG